MKPTTRKFTSMCKRLWLVWAVLALIGPAGTASAWLITDVTYEGTLSFKGKIVNQCPALYPGDTVAFSISRSFGDSIPRPRSKATLWFGVISAETSSGVPIEILGTLVGDTSQATLYITELIVGGTCYISGLNLSVRMFGDLDW